MTPTSTTPALAPSRGTTLGELARVLGAVDVRGDAGVVVTGVRQDSRRVSVAVFDLVDGHLAWAYDDQ